MNRSAHIAAALLAAAGWAGAAFAVNDAAGRWEGEAEIPGAPMRLVVDLARGNGGRWVGSVTLPGRGVKGAPLDDVNVADAGVRFGLAQAFNGAPGPVPLVELAWRGDRLAGHLRQGGLSAPLTLARSGAAQVDLPVRATAVERRLEGTWVGRYELGGVPRDVTLTLANRPGDSATGQLLIVGKRTSQLTVDHVVQGREFITLTSTEAGYRIEGRWATSDGSIDAQVVQGPFEATLVLRKQAGAKP